MSSRTNPARAGKRTVAEEAPAHEDEAVAEPTADVVEEPSETLATEPEAPDDVVDDVEQQQGTGVCDNHPDRTAVVVTNFPWTPPQRFCNQCVPQQYRYLVPS